MSDLAKGTLLKSGKGRVPIFLDKIWQYNGKTNIFHLDEGKDQKFKVSGLILTTNGDTWSKDIEGSSVTSTTLKKYYNEAKKLLVPSIKKIEVVGKKNGKGATQTLSTGKLLKTTEFGGAGGGEGIKLGGKVTEALSEGFFCVYMALKLNGKLAKFNPSVFKTVNTPAKLNLWCSSEGISTMLTYQLKDTSFTKHAKNFDFYLSSPHGNTTIDGVLRQQVDSFDRRSEVSLNKSFYIQRQDMLKETGADPYEIFSLLSQRIKKEFHLSSAPRDDKWNPGDVWAIDAGGISAIKACANTARDKAGLMGQYQAGILNSLNMCVQEQWKEKHLYPISLKLPGGHVHITLENEKDASGAGVIKKVIEFEKIKFANSNQDVQVYFDLKYTKRDTGEVVDTFKLKLKTKTKSGGHRFEIEAQKGGGARYGTIGMGGQEYIVNETAPAAVRHLNDFRNQHEDLVEQKYLDSSDATKWINADEMGSKLKEVGPDKFATTMSPYFEELYNLLGEGGNPIPGQKGEWYLNKSHSGEIGYLLSKITRPSVKNSIIQNIYDIANSQRFAVGLDVTEAQMKAMKKGAPGEPDIELIDPSNLTTYRTLFESSLHYVVK